MEYCRRIRAKNCALWDEFEAGETPEARFAHTMDNIQPTMLNDASKGKAWATRGVHLSQILGRNKNTAKGSETLWNYSYENFITPSLREGKIKTTRYPKSNRIVGGSMSFIRQTAVSGNGVRGCYFEFEEDSVGSVVVLEAEAVPERSE